MRIYDLDGTMLDPMEIPPCPLCDQPIMRDNDAAAIGICRGSLVMIHEDCGEDSGSPWREGGEP